DLSTSPSGKKTTFASCGTSISPMVRKALRAKASDCRHFSPKLRSLMIFFRTATQAAFLSSGLFHFLIVLFFSGLLLHKNISWHCLPEAIQVLLQVPQDGLELLCVGDCVEARIKRERSVIGPARGY